MKQVRCAIVGAGWWGTTAHVPAVLAHPQAKLVAVQHQDARTARKIARDFEVPHACTTLEEVLAIDELDAAIVSSVPCAHYEQARALLARGLHVLIEKPMTITAAEAQRLVRLAERRQVHFLISAPWHYTSHSIEAQRLVRSGALGQLKMISILMTNFSVGLYRGLPWERLTSVRPKVQEAAEPYLNPGRTAYCDARISGGGQSYCQLPHCAGYVGYLTGGQPAEVFARFDNDGADVDIYDAVNFKLGDGTLVSLATHGATMCSERHYEVRIYGARGMILQELWKGTLEYHDQDCKITKYPPLPEAEIYPSLEPANNLIDAVLGRAPNRSPASYGAFAMEVIDAAVRSARTGKNIRLRRVSGQKSGPSKSGPAPRVAGSKVAGRGNTTRSRKS